MITKDEDELIFNNIKRNLEGHYLPVPKYSNYEQCEIFN